MAPSSHAEAVTSAPERHTAHEISEEAHPGGRRRASSTRTPALARPLRSWCSWRKDEGRHAIPGRERGRAPVSKRPTSGALVWGFVVGVAACSSSSNGSGVEGLPMSALGEVIPPPPDRLQYVHGGELRGGEHRRGRPRLEVGDHQRSVRGHRVVPRAVRVRRLFVLRRMRQDVRDRRLSGRRPGHRRVHGQALPVVRVDSDEQCGRRRGRLSVGLFVVMARAAPAAVVFRRGRSSWANLTLWNTETDAFTPGAVETVGVYEEKEMRPVARRPAARLRGLPGRSPSNQLHRFVDGRQQGPLAARARTVARGHDVWREGEVLWGIGAWKALQRP